MPLEHTDVAARVDGYLSAVEVTQRFHNPYATKIEAVYTFPLPQNAAVNGFLMTIGDRTIRGIVREREEAERIYTEARARGHHAALMTQQRPNVFTQKVANLEPGQRIDVELTYFGALVYDDDAYEFVFPMVVGPRYNPPGTPDPIHASPRGTPRASTNVTYLAPGERSGHDIAITVDVDGAGVPIEGVVSRTHVVDVERAADDRLTVRLSPSDAIPNKDFVLRIDVAGDRVRSGVLTHAGDDGTSYFSVLLVPPASLEHLARRSVEMVFVLDCSGSMSGEPIAQSKAAMRRALRRLGGDDTFQIIRFSQSASAFGPDPVPATPANVRRALAYVDELSGTGGTHALAGVRAALDFPHDPERLRTVCFLTDGFIGNESLVLAALVEGLGATRVFAFGVGSSPNRYLLDRMARVGRGAVAYLGRNDSGAAVMDAFFDRIAHPAMTDVAIDFRGAEVADVYPSTSRDLFVGRPVVVTGRATGPLPSVIGVVGTVAGERVIFDVPVEQAAEPRPALAALWARAKIADLMLELAATGDRAVEDEVLAVALAHQLMSARTAFLAVDSLSRTAGTPGTPVDVAVPLPEGVRYETTVGPEG